MTGDGINDAPALKEADIGISMGMNGSEVAKEASDMVLADDNFATIVYAIKAGRNIYSNLKKAIQYLLSCNISQVLALIFSMIFFPIIFKNNFLLLLPVQILWLNLSDSILSIMLGLEVEDKNIMKHRPMNPEDSIFSGNVINRISVNGILMSTNGVLGFLAAYFFFSENLPLETKVTICQSSAFLTMGFTQYFMTYNARNSRLSLLEIGIFSNKELNFTTLIFAFILPWTVLPPFNSFFRTLPLSLYNWITAFLLAIFCVFIAELFKTLSFIKEDEKTI